MTRRIKRALCSVLVFVLPVKFGRVMLFKRLLFSCFCSVAQKKKKWFAPADYAASVCTPMQQGRCLSNVEMGA